MDNNLKWVNEIKINRTLEALRKNNMEGYLINTENELIHKIQELVNEGSKVSLGGSMTLFETKIMEHLRSGRYELLDRYKEGLTADEIKEIYRKSFFCDAYFTSTNAITEEGELYNVDGNGNRVAAMLYGPDKVIVIAGVNKIVKDINEAIYRVENLAAPANAKRLNRKTPCTVTGKCMNCNSPERICREYTVIRKPVPNRIFVLLLNEEYGY
ncbi:MULTISPECIES: lactate utilization protein [unclassified Clostridium]|uniref:lactate utilization protein n=1 Tax=Clostridium TaxID=1485 RepID=UPI001C8B6A5F|nr:MULTISPECIES: lactate utilization protein [unclassified Clostridium]MBX9137760.1 lactate utilization protein [Clostridium sp. K12(2020)]MBX9144615.1 lactate utilization protein [Clostridium sp. K13]MDU2289270.1 lactate utilization protein [Clostridium celatum]MDU4325857.1 lactate utilization protein [Clostridium celatum]